MFFELNNSKNGVIKSISIDLSKIDKSVCDHLTKSLKGKIKIVDNKLTIKTNITFDDLQTLNDRYIELHSKFIVNNVINKPIRIEQWN